MDRKFKFSFPERNVQDSIVFSMVSEFKIEPSILRAAIDDDGCGVLILRLRGDDELIEKALRYAEDQDVEIDELGDHIMRDEQRCVSCGECVSVCPTKAFTLDPNTFKVNLNIEKCVACGSCLSACSAHAVTLTL
jgi:NAD-dependent dihydropyrimidine dehydrogenase PreA subunit